MQCKHALMKLTFIRKYYRFAVGIAHCRDEGKKGPARIKILDDWETLMPKYFFCFDMNSVSYVQARGHRRRWRSDLYNPDIRYNLYLGAEGVVVGGDSGRNEYRSFGKVLARGK